VVVQDVFHLLSTIQGEYRIIGSAKLATAKHVTYNSLKKQTTSTTLFLKIYISALCRVYMKNGFHEATLALFPELFQNENDKTFLCKTKVRKKVQAFKRKFISYLIHLVVVK
jgi:hypothetical protein